MALPSLTMHAMRLSMAVKRMRGSPDPSAKWRRDRNLRMVLDLDAGTFCGVPFGEPLAGLYRLGKCDYYSECRESATEHLDDGTTREIIPEHPDVTLNYWSKGFWISSTDEYNLDALALWVSNDEGHFGVYPGVVRASGREVSLSSHVTRDELPRAFGEPDRVQEYEGGTSMDCDSDTGSEFEVTQWAHATYEYESGPVPFYICLGEDEGEELCLMLVHRRFGSDCLGSHHSATRRGDGA